MYGVGTLGIVLPLATSVSCGGSADTSEAKPVSSVEEKVAPATAQSIVAANAAADASLHILTRLYLPGGSVFEFYEPAPGHILLSEDGGEGATVHNQLPHMSPVDLYQQLSPGTPVPSALLDAQARANARVGAGAITSTAQPTATPQSAVDATHPTATPGGGGVMTANSIQNCGPPPVNNGHCDPSWFRSNLCSVWMPGDINYNWCYYNAWNSAWAQDGSDDSEGYAASCASIGSHVFKLTADYGGGGAWTVTEGSYRWAQPGTETACGFCFDVEYDQNIRYDITNASGHEFHFCGDFADWD